MASAADTVRAQRTERAAYAPVTTCRICGGGNLRLYLDLGNLPLVNSYVSPSKSGTPDPRYPLQLLFCNDCALSQLSIVVSPEAMYENYRYRSSIATTFVEHCAEFAQHSVHTFGLGADSLVVDIASNDGCALSEFKHLGVRVLGVDPAKNLAELATQRGIPTLAEFWSAATARTIVERYGQARFVSAMNVFAHVDDVHAFLEALKIVLHPHGVAAIEVPYLLNFVNKNEFDTVYHEHLSYFLVKPLLRLAEAHGLEVFDIKKLVIHGGAIRVYLKRHENQSIRVERDAIRWLLELEKDLGLYEVETYLNFSRDVERIRQELVALVRRLKSQDKVIAAYGASAKGTVLTNFCGIGAAEISYIMDDTPEKQGCLAPETHIPIVPSSYLATHKPDYLLLLAWNFADELMQRTQAYQQAGGKYIIPIPNVRIV